MIYTLIISSVSFSTPITFCSAAGTDSYSCCRDDNYSVDTVELFKIGPGGGGGGGVYRTLIHYYYFIILLCTYVSYV